MIDAPVVAVEGFYLKVVVWVGLHPKTVALILIADIALHGLELVFKVL